MTRKQNGRKRIEFNRRKFLQTATVAGVGVCGVTAFSGGVASHPPECDVLVDPVDSHADASTVQGGVDTANSGDTVCVAEATYTEQVVINKDLTLTNVPDDSPTIEAPSSLMQFTVSGSGGDWEPVVFAFGGSESGGDVTGSETVNVNITGLTVDGRDRTSGLPVGIMLRNVRPPNTDEKGSVSDNTVTRDFVQDRTFGIVVHGGDAALKLRGNEVEEYSRVGIFADGDEGAGPDPDVNIRNNTVIGPNRADGSRDLTWAPNGIQVSSGASGKVLENTVDNNWGPALGSGIIIVDSDGVSVKDNSLARNEVGIFFGKFFADDPVGNADIQGNDIFGGDDLPGESAKMDYGTFLFDSTNSKVITNDYNTWDNGVLIAAGKNNKVVRNSFTDVDNEIIDQGDDTKNPDTDPSNP